MYLVRTPDHGPSAVKTGSFGLRPRKLNGPSICSVAGQPHRARTRVHHGSHNLNSLARVSISLPKPRESTATSEDLTGGELTRNSPIFRGFLQHLRISPMIRVGRGPRSNPGAPIVQPGLSRRVRRPRASPPPEPLAADRRRPVGAGWPAGSLPPGPEPARRPARASRGAGTACSARDAAPAGASPVPRACAGCGLPRRRRPRGCARTAGR